MADFRAPIEDMTFTLRHIAGLDEIASLPPFQEAQPDLVAAILEEAGKLAGGVLAPINRAGDLAGSVYENGVVRTPEGFKQAYAAFVDGGWNALPFDPDYGGQGMPWTLALAVQELWNAANMSFALCPLLNQGAVELLQAHGSPEQKAAYLPNLISGRWTGTMNLTEPQAGSDVGAVKTRAVPEGDHYRISGQKIFITYGEHDFADNIIHMVLARTPDAPAGTKGISLFIVPKFLPDAEGRPGRRNDLRCVSIEHKLGINASPTCVMAFGDDEGAIGWLIGEENRGMEYMFTMMNNARLAVGMQGAAIAERAYQQALDYARQRVQGRTASGKGPIFEHPDVRRTLLTMKALTAASRALCYYTASGLDRARALPDEAARQQVKAEVVELLTPIAKAWSTDIGCEVASLGVQIHGGMGFIEETGAAQHYRDARILPIYEGTNGIQALDLIGRKICRVGGAPARAFLRQVDETASALKAASDPRLVTIGESLASAAAALGQATDWLLDRWTAAQPEAAAGATAYLRLFGMVAGGWLLGKGALAAADLAPQANGAAAFYDGKIGLAHFYAEALLPAAAGQALVAMRGAPATLAVPDSAF